MLRRRRLAPEKGPGISTTVQDYLNYPQGVAVDDNNVYWTDFGSGTNPLGSDDGRVAFRPK